MLDRSPSVESEPRLAASVSKTLFNIKRESRPNLWNLCMQCTEITDIPPAPHDDIHFWWRSKLHFVILISKTVHANDDSDEIHDNLWLWINDIEFPLQFGAHDETIDSSRTLLRCIIERGYRHLKSRSLSLSSVYCRTLHYASFSS